MATEDGYGIVDEPRAPQVRNPELRGSVCKHLYLVLKVLPFWANRIVSDLRKQFFRTRPSGATAKPIDYMKGRKQPWKNNMEDD